MVPSVVEEIEEEEWGLEDAVRLSQHSNTAAEPTITTIAVALDAHPIVNLTSHQVEVEVASSMEPPKPRGRGRKPGPAKFKPRFGSQLTPEDFSH